MTAQPEPVGRPIRYVTLYTKPGCHLCEQAEDLLDECRQRYDVRVTAIDITTDLATFERYRYEIPVIVVAGGGTVAGRIDARGLLRALGAGTPA